MLYIVLEEEQTAEYVTDTLSDVKFYVAQVFDNSVSISYHPALSFQTIKTELEQIIFNISKNIAFSNLFSFSDEVKEIKAAEAEERPEQKKKEKQAEIDAQNEAIIQEHVEEQNLQREDGVDEKSITCAAINKSGKRCGKKVLPGQSYCTIHEKVEQRPDGKKTQCTHVKETGVRCKMQTTNKSGKCYYHD